MTLNVDDIDLDKENVAFNYAAELVNHTDKFIYLTGKAGTGKTTFLKYIRNNTKKNTVVIAPTGVAAINAGGVTINSFFQLPFGPFVPNDPRLRTRALNGEDDVNIFSTFRYKEDKRKIIQTLELLIIDEVSMVRADTLDVIDRILRVFRNNPHQAFGGVQVILIGDTFQLSPIANREQWEILSRFYESRFFFSSKVIQEHTPLYIELKKIYRQNEQEFIDLLNRVRVNNLTEDDFHSLNSKYDPTFSSNGSDYIMLATHNRIVNDTNLLKLEELETQPFTFQAKVTGIFPDKLKPTDHALKLKVGAQVMFIKNDIGDIKSYFNGKIGRIKDFKDDSIVVAFDDDSQVEVERSEWTNIQYTYDDKKKSVVEKAIGTFTQFPIRLAWAITVHKSQGLTFEKVIADLGSAFAAGQVYVALSRCTTFSGLQLKTQITQYAIRTDPKVLKFAQNETPGTLILEELNTGKADFNYKKAREEFAAGNIKGSFDFFKKALKFRNDIDTDVFEKFIKTRVARLTGNRKKFNRLLENESRSSDMLRQARETIKEHLASLESKEEEISEQQVANEELQSKIKELEKEIKALKKSLTANKTASTKLKNKIVALKKEAKAKDQLF